MFERVRAFFSARMNAASENLKDAWEMAKSPEPIEIEATPSRTPFFGGAFGARVAKRRIVARRHALGRTDGILIGGPESGKLQK